MGKIIGRVKVTGVQRSKSRFGGDFFYVFFKDMEGKSYRTCIYPKYRNFAMWGDLIEERSRKSIDIYLTGLTERKEGQIDADSLNNSGQIVTQSAPNGGEIWR